MYLRFWNLLPGPLAVRVTIAVITAVAVLLLLMGLVFPTIESLLPASEVAFS